MSEEEKKEELENIILEFIKETVKEPLHGENAMVLPAMVHELRELWKD